MAKRTRLVGAGEEIRDPRAPLFSLVTGLIIISLLLAGKWLSDWVYGSIRVNQWFPWLTCDGFSVV
jgi:hypothetical protein